MAKEKLSRHRDKYVVRAIEAGRTNYLEMSFNHLERK